MLENFFTTFSIYFGMGWDHIFVWDALDHHLYLLSLVLLFDFKNSKTLLILLTAFTFGHFLSMWLSAMHWASMPSNWVEFLIAFSIFANTCFNLVQFFGKKQIQNFGYPISLGFGFIHGLGFSVVLNMLLSEDNNYYLSFFSFNLGVELAQIIVVFLLLSVGFLLKNKWGLPKKYWILACSIPLLFLSIQMMWERIPSLMN